MNTPRTLLAGAVALVLSCALDGSQTSRVAPPPAPRETVILPDLQFPQSLVHRGITGGEVNVLLKIGPDGRLIDALPTSYTHKLLLEVTLDALEHGKFQPLLVDNQPITTIVQLVVRFETQGLVVIERRGTDAMSELPPGRFAYETCQPERLDRPLQPIAVVPPEYPQSICQQGAKGKVVIDYYIDESGRVRIPVIRETASELLAGPCLAAIEQWKFNPPLSRNKPVLVRVRQAFEFVPENKKS